MYGKILIQCDLIVRTGSNLKILSADCFTC